MDSPELTRWHGRGRRVRLVDGAEVFALAEGPDSGEPILILHGFPTCSLDFRLALPLLSARHRVVLHDHLGFGLSDKPPGFSCSLMEQADAAQAVWRALGVSRGHLLAHDYGTSVATELLARRERVFCPWSCSPSLDLLWGRRDPIAVPAVAEKLAREIPRARLTWLEDLGHYPMLEAPERWAEAVVGFLADARA